MSNIIRKPIQQRSIDTKKKIVDAGYQMFAQKGYFNTNTAEIAKCANVSTGIVYGYFHDKRDILLEVLDLYIENVFKPIFKMFDSITKPLNFNEIISHIVDETVEIHRKNSEIHEALYSLVSSDEAVKLKFLNIERNLTSGISNKLIELGFDKDNVYERVHISFETIQSYGHECVFDKHSYIDYKVMREIVIKMISSLFQ